MPNFFKKNSFHILGLDVFSSHKETQKRSREILKYIDIGDVPIYPSDLKFFSDFRNPILIKEAVNRLSLPQKNIKDTFFWFYVDDKISQEALSLFYSDRFEDSFNLLNEQSEGSSIKSLFYKKNLAILYSIYLFNRYEKSYLIKSIDIWGEIVNSDKFWNSFFKVYKLNDDLDVCDEVLFDFRKNILTYLSDLYTEMYQITGNSNCYSIFFEKFKIKGLKFEDEILHPLKNRMLEIIKKLEDFSVKINEDKEVPDFKELKSNAINYTDCLNEISDLGFSSDFFYNEMSDKFIIAIINLSISINNELSDSSVAYKLLKSVKSIKVSSGVKNRLNKNINIFLQNAFVKKAEKMMEDNDYESLSDLYEKEKNKRYFKDKEFSAYADMISNLIRLKVKLNNLEYSNQEVDDDLKNDNYQENLHDYTRNYYPETKEKKENDFWEWFGYIFWIIITILGIAFFS